MKVDRDQLKALAASAGLEIPEADFENVRIRVQSLLTAMEAIEAELGEQMDAVEPLPPVFPREDYQ